MRKDAQPNGHWHWPVAVNHSHGLRDGELIFVGGQFDLDSSGGVRHPGDLQAQTGAALDRVEAVLAEHDADLGDLVKLVVFYLNRGDVNEKVLLDQIRARCPAGEPPALAAVPLPNLAYPGLVVAVEAIAMRGVDGARLGRTASNPTDHWDWPFSHGLRCGELIFVGTQMPLDRAGKVLYPGDPVAQAEANIDNLRSVLAEFGAGLDAVCRLNTFYLGYGTAEDWTQAGRIRGNAFDWPGPVGTGTPVPELYPEGLTQRQEAVAMLGVDGLPLDRTALRPKGHWDWPVPVNFQQAVKVGRLVFVGGQIAARGQAEVLHPAEPEAQIRETMRNIEAALECVGVRTADIVKLNAFYKGGAGPEQLHRVLSICSSYLPAPGPVITAVPLVNLGLEDLEIEIEAYAVVD